jgi:hypothetical protein
MSSKTLRYQNQKGAKVQKMNIPSVEQHMVRHIAMCLAYSLPMHVIQSYTCSLLFLVAFYLFSLKRVALKLPALRSRQTPVKITTAL